jgi:hypothetical protein
MDKENKQEVTIDIYDNRAVLQSENKTKEINNCSDQLDALIKGLSAIKTPCKIKLNCEHPLLKRLYPELDKGLHNINELAQGYDKWQVLSLLLLMKKIRNIS